MLINTDELHLPFLFFPIRLLSLSFVERCGRPGIREKIDYGVLGKRIMITYLINMGRKLKSLKQLTLCTTDFTDTLAVNKPTSAHQAGSANHSISANNYPLITIAVTS